MSEEKLPPIRDEVVIDRPLADVWRVLTEERFVPRWLGCLNYKAVVGHVFYMQPDPAKAAQNDPTGATHCEILALEAPHLFRFSWFVPNFPATSVSFTLHALEEARTRVAFEHAGWDQFSATQIRPIRDLLDGGWKGFVLPGLKKTAEA